MSKIGGSKIYNYSKEELQNLLDTSNGYADILRKMDLNPKGANPETLKRVIKEYDLDITKLNKNRDLLFIKNGKDTANKSIKPLSEILKKGVRYSSYKLLYRLYKDGIKERKCERCKITTWEGEQISFHLHHKDGDRLNNELGNLQVLCPNCHSLTDNFAGKRTKKKYYCVDCGSEILKRSTYCKKCANKHIRGKIKAEIEKNVKQIARGELKDLIRTTPFTTIAKQFNVSDNAIRKWCIKYNLPSKSSEIKKYSEEEWINI